MNKNIDEILSDNAFIKIMQKHCYEILAKLIELGVEFNIVANTEFVEYEPDLPPDLNPNKNPFVLFVLEGYTFESIDLKSEKMVFHAGFGANDIEAFVSVDLGAITQIQVGGDIIFVNFSYYKRENFDAQTQSSISRFLNNPANKDSLK